MSKTILVVDDDPIFMETTATLLSAQRNAAVLRARNGKEALVHLDTGADTISLIICDLNMPERDGIEVILELSKRKIKTPVVIITGAIPAVVNSAEILARAYGINVVSLLIKPVNFHQLDATLDAALAA